MSEENDMIASRLEKVTITIWQNMKHPCVEVSSNEFTVHESGIVDNLDFSFANGALFETYISGLLDQVNGMNEYLSKREKLTIEVVRSKKETLN